MTKKDVKDRAVKMAIELGEMPNCEFIWMRQRSENNNECFGLIPDCQNLDCRWAKQCKAICYMSFDDHFASV